MVTALLWITASYFFRVYEPYTTKLIFILNQEVPWIDHIMYFFLTCGEAYTIPGIILLCRTLCVIPEIILRYQLGANFHHVPGLCLLVAPPTLAIKLWLCQKPYFHIFDFFSETTRSWHFILCQKIP